MVRGGDQGRNGEETQRSMRLIGRDSLKDKESTIMWKTFKRFKAFATWKSSFGKLAVVRSAAILIGILACIAFQVAKGQRSRNLWPSLAADKAVWENLGRAESQINANLDAEIAAVKAFFAAARQRTPAYAETVLGWRSKWKLSTDYVTGRQQHAAFLQQQFEELIFSNQELADLVQQSVSGFLRETDDIEAQALVRLQADLDRLPAGSLPSAMDVNQIRTVLNDALHQAGQSARTDLGAAVGRELASYVTGEVLTCAATQLATSAGILGTGAGSSWATFGAGIVIGIIIDAIVTKIYEWQFDPVGNLTGMLNAQLDQLEALILEGTSESPGLRGRLSHYSSERNAARREAIQRAIHAP
ncbi:MAG TPA: hypothetical protein PK867_25980 [Pirellulales bacterium]|nr:hypothetical protein [Pirellulales bacterium]